MTAPASSPPGPIDRDAQLLPQAEPRLWMSALADGEREALAHGATLWREDREAREAWHLYHLIGDVLRSDDLACAPHRDATFLANLRTRLAAEPVPLAPSPPAPQAASAAASARRLGWRAPAAVAAGFVAVGVTLVVLMRTGGIDGGIGGSKGSVQLAGTPASMGGSGVQVELNSQPSVTAGLVAERRMIRDARLDAYLRAHQSVRGNSPAAMPGGGVRNVELLVVPEMPMPRVQGGASGPR